MMVLEVSGSIADNFQFWMATTFAVIVVTYNAGERLSPVVRMLIAALYLVAVSMFYLHYRISMASVHYYMQFLTEMGRGGSYPQLQALEYLRSSVMLLGSLMAVAFIFKPQWAGNSAKSRNKA